MKFNQTKFTKQQFVDRTEDVEVSALRPWFDFDEDDQVKEEGQKDGKKKQEVLPPCLWQVRGLTGSEFATMMVAASKSKNLNTIIEAIGSTQVKTEELKNIMGLGEDTPEDLAKRLEQLVLGSVEPSIDSSMAVKLASTFPIEFYILTNKITALTGLGRDIKK